jgi:hypothetical protein
MRKSVPAATTRRERIEGECVGFGEGRRRDMSTKQPPLGNSASGDEHPYFSSAIGANYSICGPTPQPAQIHFVEFWQLLSYSKRGVKYAKRVRGMNIDE